MSVKKVLKFGGTSIANPERIRDVASIILGAAKKERVVVIISAFQDVTDNLLDKRNWGIKNFNRCIYNLLTATCRH